MSIQIKSMDKKKIKEYVGLKQVYKVYQGTVLISGSSFLFTPPCFKQGSGRIKIVPGYKTSKKSRYKSWQYHWYKKKQIMYHGAAIQVLRYIKKRFFSIF